MHQCRDPRLSRYGKTGKELLVDYINYLNNRALSPDQLLFGVPVMADERGLTEVQIQFSKATGWSDEKSTLTYHRQDLSHTLGNEPIVVHVPTDSPAALYAAIQEQYGLLIEPAFVTLTLVSESLDGINTLLPGFDREDGGEQTLELMEEYGANRSYILTFMNHLVFIGAVQIYTRRSLTLLANTIDSRIDLRQFYKDGNGNLPQVDLLIPNGEFRCTDDKLGYTTRRAYEEKLYEIDVGTFIDEASPIPELLRKLSGDPWVCTPAQDVDFNLHGSKFIYNDFVSKDYKVTDPAFNYVLAIQLGTECANLTGFIKIAYRYSDVNTPGNLAYDQAHVKPVFSR